MKKIIPFLFLFYFHLLSKSLDAQSLAWAGQFKGISLKIVEGTALDLTGNCYITGGFQSTVDFDPGPAMFNLTASGNLADIFIVKLSVNGTLLWAKQIGANLIDVARAITVNPSGYIEIAGDFRGTVDFDPGPAVINLTAGPNGDVFILRLNEAGNFVSVRQFSTTAGSSIGINDIKTDRSGNLVLAMTFNGTIDFDPGAGIFNLTSTGPSDMAICKFSSAGNFSWAKQVTTSSTTIPNSLIVDVENNIVYGGYFYGSMDFDPGPAVFDMTSFGASDAFISKLDAQGNFIWAKQFRNTDLCSIVCMASDAGSNIYVSGYFEDTTDFDPGPGTIGFRSFGDRDAYVVKLTKEGNFVWADRFGGAFGDGSDAMDVGTDGAVYVSVSFIGSADLDPGPGTYTLNSNGDFDFSITKLNVNGGLDWAKQIGGTSSDGARLMHVDNLDNIYFTGVFGTTVDFDPGPGVFNLTAGAVYPYSDIFVAKLSKSNIVTGVTFQDANGDGIRQANELSLANVVLKGVRNGINYYAISDTNGMYRMETDTGSYTISPALPLFYTSIIPTTHSASFGVLYGQLDSANHFGLITSATVNDMRIYITNLGPARAGRPTYYRVTYTNIGTQSASGTIVLTHDNNLAFTSANPAPNNYSLPVITWNYTNLAPSMSRSILVEYLVSTGVVQASFLKSYAVINPVAGDFDPGNNIDSIYHLVIASMDPNDKKVNPSGSIGTDFIANGKYLDYTIRFQNTGNDTAFLVVIKDTLSTNLDVSSFEMLSASHPYSVNMHANGIVEWRFENILLPDSTINEARSHGFVRYRVKPKSSLVPGNQVKNRSAIYFDYNAPVMTNETLNTVTIITSVNPGANQIEAKIFPNPAGSVLFLQVKGRFRYYLYDVNGKTVFFSNDNRDNAVIDISGLSKGVYLIEIKTTKGKSVKKIVVQ